MSTSLKPTDTLIEFSLTPLGTGESVAGAIARVTERVRASGLTNELHAMGTIVEGDLDACMNLVRDCIQQMLQEAPRVTVALKMDVRPGHRNRIRGKVESVETILRKC